MVGRGEVGPRCAPSLGRLVVAQEPSEHVADLAKSLGIKSAKDKATATKRFRVSMHTVGRRAHGTAQDVRPAVVGCIRCVRVGSRCHRAVAILSGLCAQAAVPEGSCFQACVSAPNALLTTSAQAALRAHLNGRNAQMAIYLDEVSRKTWAERSKQNAWDPWKQVGVHDGATLL